jgi:hypothetical protein
MVVKAKKMVVQKADELDKHLAPMTVVKKGLKESRRAGSLVGRMVWMDLKKAEKMAATRD